MVTLQLSDEQVIELVKQLPPGGKQAVLEALTSDSGIWWQLTLAQGEDHLRRLSAERGRNWEVMSEEDRESFVDELLHEA